MKLIFEYRLPNKTGLGKPKKLIKEMQGSDEPIPRVGEFVTIGFVGSEYFIVSKILWSIRQDPRPADTEVTIVLRHSDGWYKTGK
jgi:hypothetical protein